MRITAMTVVALTAALITGCGGVASSCSRAAMKVGTGSAAKGTAVIGTEAGFKGTGLAVGAHSVEEGVSAGSLGKAFSQPDEIGVGLRSRPTPMDDFADDAWKTTEEPAAAGQSESSLAEEAGQEILQQGIEQIPDLFDRQGSSEDDTRDYPRN